MSTNSNEGDQLMSQDHPKQTKLQKFLRQVIDQQTVHLINKYLDSNQNPANEPNTKLDKIKLYQDLLIIQRFKNMESKIGNRRKIQEICGMLKREIGFQVLTIRERIQKKLSNVTKEDIINHIQNNANFAFDSKRKLVPLKNPKPPTKQQQNFPLDSHRPIQTRSKSSKPQKKSKIIYINSSVSDSEDSIEQVPPITSNNNNNNTKGNVIQMEMQMERKQKQEEISGTKGTGKGKGKIRKEWGEECYNQFRAGSEHDSDEEILVRKEGTGYRLTTLQGEAVLKQLLESMKDFYLKEKERPQFETPAQPQPLQPFESSTPKHQKTQPTPMNNIINIDQSDQNESIPPPPQPQPHSHSTQNDPQPPPEQLYWYCSIEDWKLANSDKQYSHLKWYKDQDQFLMRIVNDGNSQQAMSGLQVLKKFKEGKNIVARIGKLGLVAPNNVMVSLLANQNQ